MEGELFIKVIGATGLFKKEHKGDPNPYCKLIFGKEVIANTKVINSTCNPIWNESFRIPVKKRSDYLEIKVYSKKAKDKKKKSLGVCILTIEEIEGNKEAEMEYTLQKKEKKQNVSGSIRLKLIYTSKHQNQNTIQMQILDVQDVKPLKRRSYIKVKYGAQKLKTVLTDSGENPSWNETFSISLWGPSKLNILFVKENKSVVGMAKIDLKEYRNKFDKDILIPLKKRKEQIGNLRIKLINKGSSLYSFEDSVQYADELSESSYDISMDSESESEISQLETSISDSGEATSFENSESEKISFGDVFIHIRNVKTVNPKYKQEFYFICSSKSDYVSSPKVLEEDVIKWDEKFFAELYSMDAPLVIKFYKRKSPNCIGRLLFNFNEFNESPIDGWYELEGKSEDCCLYKVNVKIEYFSNFEFYDNLLATNYILDASILKLNNVRKNHPFYIKSTILGTDISTKTNTFRGNDSNLVVDESLSLTLKKNSKIVEFSVYTTHKNEEKLLGKVYFHLGYLNEKNNYFFSHLFPLQQGSKMNPSDISIGLKLKLTRSSDHLLFTLQNRKKDFENIDLNINLIIVGPSGSGKTSLLHRFLEDQFLKNTTVTITDDKRVFYDVEDKCVSVIIKDTAGMERFSDIIVKTFYRNADGVLLVFDKTAKDHLERIRTYFHNIQEYCPKAKVMLIGSKCENLDEIVFSSDDIQKLKEEYKVKYMDASAKDNINVAYIFHSLLEEIYQVKKDLPSPTITQQDVHSIKEIPQTSKKCKCTIS